SASVARDPPAEASLSFNVWPFPFLELTTITDPPSLHPTAFSFSRPLLWWTGNGNDSTRCAYKRRCAHELLHFLGFEHFRQTGRTVTGSLYSAWPMGPVPDDLWHE